MKKSNKKNNQKKFEQKFDKNDAPKVFDYKDIESLKKFVTERGKIVPRSRTGLSARKQRDFATAVKRARMLALMPFAN